MKDGNRKKKPDLGGYRHGGECVSGSPTHTKKITYQEIATCREETYIGASRPDKEGPASFRGSNLRVLEGKKTDQGARTTHSDSSGSTILSTTQNKEEKGKGWATKRKSMVAGCQTLFE